MSTFTDPTYAASRILVEEALRTALALHSVVCNLLDDDDEDEPDDSGYGAISGETLLECLAGTCRPAVAAAGPRNTRIAAQLIAALRERVIADLEEALRRKRGG